MAVAAKVIGAVRLSSSSEFAAKKTKPRSMKSVR